MPSLTNPQAFNRYSYVNNSPVRYNDPSGHVMQKALFFEGDGPLALASYGVFVQGNISSKTLLAVGKAVRDIAKALSKVLEKDPVSSFKEAFGGNVGVRSWAADGCDCAADTWRNEAENRWEIRIFNADWAADHPRLFVHEFGHLYYNSHHKEFTPMGSSLQRPDYGNLENGYHGFAGGQFTWQFSVYYMGYPTEVFADMFLGWVYDHWNFIAPGYQGQARKDYLNVNMSHLRIGGAYDK